MLLTYVQFFIAIFAGEIVLTLPEDDHLNGFNLLAQSFKPRSGAHSDSEKVKYLQALNASEQGYNENIIEIKKFLHQMTLWHF